MCVPKAIFIDFNFEGKLHVAHAPKHTYKQTDSPLDCQTTIDRRRTRKALTNCQLLSHAAQKLPKQQNWYIQPASVHSCTNRWLPEPTTHLHVLMGKVFVSLAPLGAASTFVKCDKLMSSLTVYKTLTTTKTNSEIVCL